MWLLERQSRAVGPSRWAESSQLMLQLNQLCWLRTLSVVEMVTDESPLGPAWN